MRPLPLPLVLLAVAASAALCLAPRISSAQTVTGTSPGTVTSPQAAKLARADAAFLKQAAENGHAEVKSSELAGTKASSAKVKAFAKQMVEDHTKAGSELSALAASKGIELSSDPSLPQQAKIKLLGLSDGGSFDAKYADQFGVKAHEETVKLFEKGAKEAKDEDVKAWANKTLPTLRQHLEHAKALKASLEG